MKLDDLTAFYRENRRLVWYVAGGLVLLLLLVLLFSSRRGGAGGEPQPTFIVEEGPLTISITLSGTIRALEQEIITCDVEGQTTLIYLIDEGTRVSEGELLAELDASGLQDNLVEQQIQVQNAEAAYIGAREQLAVTKNQSDSDIAKAELDFRFAKEDLTQYLEGQFKQELMSAESKITLAEEELQLATRKLEWSDKLFKENYLSQAERDGDELAYNRSHLDVELAKADKKLLEDYTYKRQVAQLESDVDQTERALERVKLKALADIVQAEASLKAKEAEWKQQQEKEQKTHEQLSKTRIMAPRDGLVVYASSVKASWRGNDEPLEEGQTVRERQELIYLPTADLMKADLSIHESNLDQVRLGQPVIITVDARQGRTFIGKMNRIAPLPDASSMWMNPDLKVYDADVHIDGRQPELRTGMSCMAEILVDRYDDAIYVPVQAVMQVAGQSTVYRKKGSRFEPVAVKVGLDNNRMVRVLEGLKPGQEVLLTPPLEEAVAEDSSSHGSMDAQQLNGLIEASKKEAANKPAVKPAVEAGEGTASGAPPGQGNMTPEQREAMRKRIESMTPEQREAMRKQMGGGRSGGRPGGGRPAGGSRP